MAQVILYTSKGEVGKTTVATPIAWNADEIGHRTIIPSPDTAHSLSDSFGVSLDNSPQPITTNQWGQEAYVYQTLRRLIVRSRLS